MPSPSCSIRQAWRYEVAEEGALVVVKPQANIDSSQRQSSSDFRFNSIPRLGRIRYVGPISECLTPLASNDVVVVELMLDHNPTEQDLTLSSTMFGREVFPDANSRCIAVAPKSVMRMKMGPLLDQLPSEVLIHIASYNETERWKGQQPKPKAVPPKGPAPGGRRRGYHRPPPPVKDWSAKGGCVLPTLGEMVVQFRLFATQKRQLFPPPQLKKDGAQKPIPLTAHPISSSAHMCLTCVRPIDEPKLWMVDPGRTAGMATVAELQLASPGVPFACAKKVAKNFRTVAEKTEAMYEQVVVRPTTVGVQDDAASLATVCRQKADAAMKGFIEEAEENSWWAPKRGKAAPTEDQKKRHAEEAETRAQSMRDWSGFPTPIVATSHWHDFMQCLLDSNVKLSAKPKGMPAFPQDLAEQLLKHVAGFGPCDVLHRMDGTGWTALAAAVAYGASVPVVSALVKLGSNVTCLLRPSESPLHMASTRLDEVTVDALLEGLDKGRVARVVHRPLEKDGLILSRSSHMSRMRGGRNALYLANASPVDCALGRGSKAHKDWVVAHLLPKLLSDPGAKVDKLYAAFHSAAMGILEYPATWLPLVDSSELPWMRTEFGELLQLVVGSPRDREANLEILERCLSHCTAPLLLKIRSWQKTSILHTAAASNNLGAVKLISEKHPALLTTGDSQRRVPLTLALRKGSQYSAVWQLLLTQTADHLESLTPEQLLPLLQALIDTDGCAEASRAAVSKMVARLAATEPQWAGSDHAPFGKAVEGLLKVVGARGTVPVVEQLLSVAKGNATQVQTHLLYAAISAHNVAVVQHCLAAGGTALFPRPEGAPSQLSVWDFALGHCHNQPEQRKDSTRVLDLVAAEFVSQVNKDSTACVPVVWPLDHVEALATRDQKLDDPKKFWGAVAGDRQLRFSLLIGGAGSRVAHDARSQVVVGILREKIGAAAVLENFFSPKFVHEELPPNLFCGPIIQLFDHVDRPITQEALDKVGPRYGTGTGDQCWPCATLYFNQLANPTGIYSVLRYLIKFNERFTHKVAFMKSYTYGSSPWPEGLGKISLFDRFHYFEDCFPLTSTDDVWKTLLGSEFLLRGLPLTSEDFKAIGGPEQLPKMLAKLCPKDQPEFAFKLLNSAVKEGASVVVYHCVAFLFACSDSRRVANQLQKLHPLVSSTTTATREARDAWATIQAVVAVLKRSHSASTLGGLGGKLPSCGVSHQGILEYLEVVPQAAAEVAWSLRCSAARNELGNRATDPTHVTLTGSPARLRVQMVSSPSPSRGNDSPRVEDALLEDIYSRHQSRPDFYMDLASDAALRHVSKMVDVTEGEELVHLRPIGIQYGKERDVIGGHPLLIACFSPWTSPGPAFTAMVANVGKCFDLDRISREQWKGLLDPGKWTTVIDPKEQVLEVPAPTNCREAALKLNALVSSPAVLALSDQWSFVLQRCIELSYWEAASTLLDHKSGLGEELLEALRSKTDTRAARSLATALHRAPAAVMAKVPACLSAKRLLERCCVLPADAPERKELLALLPAVVAGSQVTVEKDLAEGTTFGCRHATTDADVLAWCGATAQLGALKEERNQRALASSGKVALLFEHACGPGDLTEALADTLFQSVALGTKASAIGAFLEAAGSAHASRLALSYLTTPSQCANALRSLDNPAGVVASLIKHSQFGSQSLEVMKQAITTTVYAALTIVSLDKLDSALDVLATANCTGSGVDLEQHAEKEAGEGGVELVRRVLSQLVQIKHGSEIPSAVKRAVALYKLVAASDLASLDVGAVVSPVFVRQWARLAKDGQCKLEDTLPALRELLVTTGGTLSPVPQAFLYLAADDDTWLKVVVDWVWSLTEGDVLVNVIRPFYDDVYKVLGSGVKCVSRFIPLLEAAASLWAHDEFNGLGMYFALFRRASAMNDKAFFDWALPKLEAGQLPFQDFEKEDLMSQGLEPQSLEPSDPKTYFQGELSDFSLPGTAVVIRQLEAMVQATAPDEKSVFSYEVCQHSDISSFRSRPKEETAHVFQWTYEQLRHFRFPERVMQHLRVCSQSWPQFTPAGRKKDAKDPTSMREVFSEMKNKVQASYIRKFRCISFHVDTSGSEKNTLALREDPNRSKLEAGWSAELAKNLTRSKYLKEEKGDFTGICLKIGNPDHLNDIEVDPSLMSAMDSYTEALALLCDMNMEAILHRDVESQAPPSRRHVMRARVHRGPKFDNDPSNDFLRVLPDLLERDMETFAPLRVALRTVHGFYGHQSPYNLATIIDGRNVVEDKKEYNAWGGTFACPDLHRFPDGTPSESPVCVPPVEHWTEGHRDSGPWSGRYAQGKLSAERATVQHCFDSAIYSEEGTMTAEQRAELVFPIDDWQCTKSTFWQVLREGCAELPSQPAAPYPPLQETDWFRTNFPAEVHHEGSKPVVGWSERANVRDVKSANAKVKRLKDSQDIEVAQGAHHQAYRSNKKPWAECLFRKALYSHHLGVPDSVAVGYKAKLSSLDQHHTPLVRVSCVIPPPNKPQDVSVALAKEMCRYSVTPAKIKVADRGCPKWARQHSAVKHPQRRFSRVHIEEGPSADVQLAFPTDPAECRELLQKTQPLLDYWTTLIRGHTAAGTAPLKDKRCEKEATGETHEGKATVPVSHPLPPWVGVGFDPSKEFCSDVVNLVRTQLEAMQPPQDEVALWEKKSADIERRCKDQLCDWDDDILEEEEEEDEEEY